MYQKKANIEEQHGAFFYIYLAWFVPQLPIHLDLDVYNNLSCTYTYIFNCLLSYTVSTGKTASKIVLIIITNACDYACSSVLTVVEMQDPK